MFSFSKSALLMAAVLATVGYLCVAPSSANLIQNGSFETATSYPAAGGSLGVTTGNPSPMLTNWSITRSSSTFAWYASSGWHGGPDTGNPTYNAEDQTYFLNVSTDYSGSSSPEFSSTETAYQSFSVTGGTTYDVTFLGNGPRSVHDQP